MTAGPFDSEAAAQQNPAVQEIHAAFRMIPARGRWHRSSTPCWSMRAQ